MGKTLSEKQGRRWVLTWNNPDISLEEFGARLDTYENLQYYKIAHEKGAKTGTPHFQGYFELVTKRKGSTLVSLFPGARLDLSFSDSQKASEYCGKLEKSGEVLGVIESGEMMDIKQSPKKEEMTDRLLMIKKDIDEGKSLKYLWSAYYLTMIRYYAGVYQYYQQINPGLRVGKGGE